MAEGWRELQHLELFGVLEPRALERVRRVALAIRLLREGKSVPAVRAEIRRRFRIAQPLAWRVVDMAVDLAGPDGADIERRAEAKAATPRVCESAPSHSPGADLAALMGEWKRDT